MSLPVFAGPREIPGQKTPEPNPAASEGCAGHRACWPLRPSLRAGRSASVRIRKSTPAAWSASGLAKIAERSP